MSKDDLSTGQGQVSDAAANGSTSSNVDGGGKEPETGKGKSEVKTTACVGPSMVVQPSASIEEEKKEMYDRSDELIAAELAKYCDAENLKQPSKGFRAEDELQVFPAIEKSSEILYEKYKQLKLEQKEDVRVALKERNGIIKIPNVKVRAYLCHRRLMRTPPPKSERKKLEPKRIQANGRPRHPFLTVRGEDIFSLEKLHKLRVPLSFGWRREVVLRSLVSNGRKTGDVYYYSPERIKFRSSKQVERHLLKTNSQFTLENFSFAKVKVSDNADQEIVRVAHDGNFKTIHKRPVPNKPKPPINLARSNNISNKTSNSSSAELGVPSTSVMETREVSSRQRRSIQVPKKYSSKDVIMVSTKRPASSKGRPIMEMGMLPPKYPKCNEEVPRYTAHCNRSPDSQVDCQNQDFEINTTDLFQISALQQSGRMHQEMQAFIKRSEKDESLPELKLKENPSTPKMLNKNMNGSKKIVTISTRGFTNPVAPYPCSILCPGLEGIPPTLQCTKCCCLFHAECFGLPPNLKLYNYLCSYCKGLSSSNSTTSSLRNQSKGPVTAAATTTRTVKRNQPKPMPSLRAAPARAQPEVLVAPSGIRQVRQIPAKDAHELRRATVGIGRETIMRRRQQPAPQPSQVVGLPKSSSHPIYTVISPTSVRRKPIAANRGMINRGTGVAKLSPVSFPTNRATLTKNNPFPFRKLIHGKPPAIPNLMPIGTSRGNQRKVDLMPVTVIAEPYPTTSIPPVRGRSKKQVEVHRRPQLPVKKAVPPTTISKDSSGQYIVLTVNSGITTNVDEMKKVKYVAAIKPSAGPSVKKANLRNLGADVRKSVAGTRRAPN